MLSEYTATVIIISSVIIVVMVIIMAWFNHRIVTKPLSRLTEAARNFVKGDQLSYSADIKTGDEMQELSEALAKMSGDIFDYTNHLTSIAADNERIATERNVAASVKASLMPAPLSGGGNFEVSATIESSRVLGGNFYDFFLVEPNRLCVIVGDVTGSGFPAVLFMVVAKTMIKSQIRTGMPIDQAMSIVNSQLFESTSNNMAAAVFAGVLEIPTGVFSYVNAGQNAPLMRRIGGRYELIRDQLASRLAESRNVSYRVHTMNLSQGDRLFLYTDGVKNAKNSSSETYGADRLLSLLNSPKFRDLKAEDTPGDVLGDLAVFYGGEEQTTDIGMMVLEYTKGDKVQTEIAV